MLPDTLLIAAGAFVTAVVVTWMVRMLAMSHGVIDVPNARSSHTVPTPRGGGLSIVLAVMIAAAVLAARGMLDISLCVALGGGSFVALIGFIDDRHSVTAGIRLAVHFLTAAWAMAWLGNLPALRLGDDLMVFGPLGYLLGTVGIVWTLNLFNFMDGIDGIAASEAVFVVWAGAALTAAQESPESTQALAGAFGAACCGFLVWNWPAAKIFMGDVGSGFVGFCIAVLAIASARTDPVALLVWLILGGVFFVDATVTFIRRLVRRERVFVAHRSHAYQRLARRWQSHRRVTVVMLLVNLLWLLPCAYVAQSHPAYAGWITLAALAPLVAAALAVGAGRQETLSPEQVRSA